MIKDEKLNEAVAKMLKITPEKQAAMEAEQRELAEVYGSPGARLNPEERLRGRGIELEQHAALVKNKNLLAEALAMQGRYGLAAQIATRKKLRKSYAEQMHAVERDDTPCACDTFRDEGDGTLVPTQFVESYGYSAKHEQVVPFLRCTICRDLNAMPLPEHLAEMQRTRREAEAKEKR